MILLAATETLSWVAGTTTAISGSMFGLEITSGVETYKALAQAQLPITVTTAYTVPASTQTIIKAINLVNTTASAVTGVRLFARGTAAVNQITSGFTIPAGGSATYNSDGWKVLDSNGAVTSFVKTVAGRIGDVVLVVADVSGAAPLASPAFTGIPLAPTAATITNNTQIATTAFVKNQGYGFGNGNGTVTSFSFTNGNGITGTVTNPSTTPALSFTFGNVTGSSFNGVSGLSFQTPNQEGGSGNVGVSSLAARADHIHPVGPSQTSLNGYKFDGGTGTGGTQVNFNIGFSTILGLSVTAVDTFIAGISSISTAGFLANTRSFSGVDTPGQSFRWVAVGT